MASNPSLAQFAADMDEANANVASTLPQDESAVNAVGDSTTESSMVVNQTKEEPAKSGDETVQDDGNVREVRYLLSKPILQSDLVTYQVDCMPDPKTGQQYKPTWEPEENISEEALQAFRQGCRA